MTDIGDSTQIQRQESTYETHVLEQDGGLIIQLVGKPGDKPPPPPPECPPEPFLPCNTPFPLERCQAECNQETCSEAHPPIWCPDPYFQECRNVMGWCTYAITDYVCITGSVTFNRPGYPPEPIEYPPGLYICACYYEYVSDDCHT